MQVKHCFYDEMAHIHIPAGVTLLIFSREETQLVRSIINHLCTEHDGDILDFSYVLEQLTKEENKK